MSLVSIVITLICWSMDLVHPYFYLGISIMLCIVWVGTNGTSP